MVKLLSITIAITLTIALTFIVCCGERADDQLDADEMAIYLELARSSPSREIVVSSDPIIAIGITRSEHVRSHVPSAPEEAIIDFLAKNRENRIIERDVQIDGGFVLIGSQDREKSLSGLHRFNSFSRVGFDSIRKTAIVWYSDFCAPLCGETGLYLLEYNGEKWKVVAESEKIKS